MQLKFKISEKIGDLNFQLEDENKKKIILKKLLDKKLLLIVDFDVENIYSQRRLISINNNYQNIKDSINIAFVSCNSSKVLFNLKSDYNINCFFLSDPNFSLAKYLGNTYSENKKLKVVPCVILVENNNNISYIQTIQSADEVFDVEDITKALFRINK